MIKHRTIISISVGEGNEISFYTKSVGVCVCVCVCADSKEPCI